MLIAAREPDALGRFAARRIVRTCARGARRILVAQACRAALLAAGWLSASAALGQHSDFAVPEVDPSAPILFGADEALRWEKGAYDVWVLRGRCYLQQGSQAAEAREAVLWVKHSEQFDGPQNLVIAYLEGDVRIVDGRASTAHEIRDRSWFGEFTSTAPLEIRTPPPGGCPPMLPQVFVNAQAYRDSLLSPIRRAQFTVPTPGPRNDNFPSRLTQSGVAPPPLGTATGAPGYLQTPSGVAPSPDVVAQPMGRRLRAFSRTSVKVQVQWMQNPNNPQEWVGVITPGVNLVIDGLAGFDTIDISTDRMVVWTTSADAPDLSGEKTQTGDRPLELYMEGNIVFREGDRVIYADRMYYDVNRRAGTILAAEILTPVKNFDGLARLKADVVRQVDANNLLAERAWVSSSRLGSPRYRLQTNQLTLRDVAAPATTFDGRPIVDPLTGEQQINHDRMLTSSNNFVYLGPVPVFYWPLFASDLESRQFYLKSFKFKSDSIFGQQFLTDWDLFQVFGIRNKPAGHGWIGSVDYLSERGPAAGTTYYYTGNEFYGTRGSYAGLLDAWGIKDDGLDILGSDRYRMVPEKDFRYRIFGRHRHQLPDNFQFTAELGKISDRNFLEQYYEREWDTFKDQTTGLELKHLVDNRSWSIAADMRLNKFFTQTEQLPRFDHYWLGQPLLGGWLTWYEHSSAEYARLKIVSTPTDPQDLAKFAPLPWEIAASGERLATRQEIDAPLNLGAVKLVPYALGEAAHWGEVLDGGDLQRLYGQTGVRASLPFWAADPGIQSELLNVNGIAHKVTLGVDAYVAGANQRLSQFPLYDPLDDDAQEHFRRRFAFNTFGGATPLRFDERYYALRSGMGGNVTGPSLEIADNLAAVRMNLNQRWQTKRGPAAAPKIVDWITFDTEATYFPARNRDNFGESFGLVNYDFRWHIGERFTLLSDGGFDFFQDGQQTLAVGGMLTRPENGNLYLGYRSLDGPFHMQVFIGSVSYKLSPKWFGTAAMSYDFSGTGTIGNSFSLVRIGESFLVSFNFAYDAYKDNFTGTFNVEPRFIPALARMAGAGQLAPVGIYGLD